MADEYPNLATTTDFIINYSTNANIRLNSCEIFPAQFMIRNSPICTGFTDCSILVMHPLAMQATFSSLHASFTSNCPSLVKVYGFGEVEGRQFAVLERLETNIFNHFSSKGYNMEGGNGSSFGTRFMREPVSDEIRAVIKGFSMAVDGDRYPKIHSSGADTFIVDGNCKWLFVNLNGDEKAATAELVNLFKQLLDTNSTVEATSFFSDFDSGLNISSLEEEMGLLYVYLVESFNDFLSPVLCNGETQLLSRVTRTVQAVDMLRRK